MHEFSTLLISLSPYPFDFREGELGEKWRGMSYGLDVLFLRCLMGVRGAIVSFIDYF